MAYTEARDPDSVLTTASLALIERYAGRHERLGLLPAVLAASRVEVHTRYGPASNSDPVLWLACSYQSTPQTSDSGRERNGLLAAVYAKEGDRSSQRMLSGTG
jgi:hypothetical protein